MILMLTFRQSVCSALRMLDPLESINQIHAIGGLAGGSGTHGSDAGDQLLHFMDPQKTWMLPKLLRLVSIK